MAHSTICQQPKYGWKGSFKPSLCIFAHEWLDCRCLTAIRRVVVTGSCYIHKPRNAAFCHTRSLCRIQLKLYLFNCLCTPLHLLCLHPLRPWVSPFPTSPLGPFPPLAPPSPRSLQRLAGASANRVLEWRAGPFRKRQPRLRSLAVRVELPTRLT